MRRRSPAPGHGPGEQGTDLAVLPAVAPRRPLNSRRSALGREAMVRAVATTTPGASPLPPLDLPPTRSAGDAPRKKLIEVNSARSPQRRSWEIEPGIEYHGLFLTQFNPVTMGGRGELNLELRITVYFWFNPTRSPWGGVGN